MKTSGRSASPRAALATPGRSVARIANAQNRTSIRKYCKCSVLEEVICKQECLRFYFGFLVLFGTRFLRRFCPRSCDCSGAFLPASLRPDSGLFKQTNRREIAEDRPPATVRRFFRSQLMAWGCADLLRGWRRSSYTSSTENTIDTTYAAQNTANAVSIQV